MNDPKPPQKEPPQVVGEKLEILPFAQEESNV